MEYEELPRASSTRYARVSVVEDGGRTDRKSSMMQSGDRKSCMSAIVDDLVLNLQEYHDPEPPPEELGPMTVDERVKEILDGTPFQATMAFSILLNAAVIGGETDYPELDIWHVIENVFLLIFLFELLLRIFAVGLKAFFAPGGDQMWNLFDFAIVGLGIFDWLGGVVIAHSKHLDHHDGEVKDQRGGFSTLFRMIRLLRILRVFKIVRFVKPLYMIFFGFAEAVQAACLVTILAFGSLYVSSVIMVRTYGRLPQEHSVEETDVLVRQFSSIKTSMLSLFELMANPGNLQIYHDLMQDYPALTAFLITFVIFGYGMVAVLTGVISESMFDKNQARVQEMRTERESKRELLKQKCHDLFALVKTDNRREAAPEDLEDLLPYVREMFEKLDIEYMQHEFENIIQICDIDDTGAISELEFVSVIMSLCDGVRATSIQQVHYLVSQMNVKVTKTIPQRIQSLHDEVRQITRTTIPELQGNMMNLLVKKIESQLRPTSGVLFDPVAPLEKMHVPEMNTSMATRMDAHAEMLSRKIDDLTANLREICNTPDAWNGNEYTLPDTQMIGGRLPISAGSERLPVSPGGEQNETHGGRDKQPQKESRPSKRESNAAGTPGGVINSGQRDNDKRTAPLSAPHANAGKNSSMQENGNGNARVSESRTSR